MAILPRVGTDRSEFVLESCTTLRECEEKLASLVNDVSFLGEIRLDEPDYTRLSGLIADEAQKDISRATARFERHYPTCLAFFLTWIGHKEYEEGTFWPAVEEVVGELDINWRVRWGKIFLDFLEDHSLVHPVIPGSHSYVAPILLHGGIPVSCYEEYFERILLPMVERELMDPVDPEEIIFELTARREDHQERSEKDLELAEFEDRVRDLHKMVAYFESAGSSPPDDSAPKGATGDEEEKSDTESLGDREPAVHPPWKDRKRELEEQEAKLRGIIDSFSPRDRKLIELSATIEDLASQWEAIDSERENLESIRREQAAVKGRLAQFWSKVSSQPWDDKYTSTLREIPLEELSVDLDRISVDPAPDPIGQSNVTPGHPADSLPWWFIAFGTLTAMAGILSIPLVALLLGVPAATVTGVALYVVGGLVFFGSAGFFLLRTRRNQHTGPQSAETEDTITGSPLPDGLSQLPLSVQRLNNDPNELFPILSQLADLAAELLELQDQEEAATYRHQSVLSGIRDIAEEIKINADAEPAVVLEKIVDDLRSAVRRQQAADRARKELDEDVLPALEALGDAPSPDLAISVSEDAEVGSTRPADPAGGGDPVPIDLSEDLDDGVPGEDPPHDEYLERARARYKSAIERTQGIRENLERLPEPFSGIDEPIRRHLLYGESWAEQTLVESVGLAYAALQNGSPPETDYETLPPAMVQAFRKWWENTQHSIEQTDRTEARTPMSRARSPIISLDPERREVLCRLPAQRVSSELEAPKGEFELEGDAPNQTPWRTALRLYRIQNGLLETNELEFPLPYPAHQYECRLLLSGDQKQRWSIETPREGRVSFAFDRSSGRLIRDEALPRERIWFLLHKDYEVRESSLIIQDAGPLPGEWKPFRLLELDLEDARELEVRSRRTDRTVRIPTTWGAPPQVALVGADPSPGINSNGERVYSDAPPSLQFPYSPDSSLREWRLSFVHELTSGVRRRRHVRLNELSSSVELDPERSRGVISLDHPELIGQGVWGQFALRLRKSPYRDWQQSFAVLPEHELTFNKDYFPPHRPGKPAKAEVELSSSRIQEVHPRGRVEAVEETAGGFKLSADTSLDSMEAEALCRLGPDTVRIPFSIALPKISWRIRGHDNPDLTSWNDSIQEVWMGDPPSELGMVIRVPQSLDTTEATLAIKEIQGSQVSALVADRTAEFDLMPLVDRMRSGPGLQTFQLQSLRRSKSELLSGVTLINARTRWEVDNLECVQINQGDSIVLQVSWEEKGHASKKQLSLWQLTEPKYRKVTEQVVRGDTSKTSLVLQSSRVSTGRYLIQVHAQDPWSTTAAPEPEAGASGTFVFDIVGGAELRKGQSFTIENVDDPDRPAQRVRAGYLVTIIGKIVYRELPGRAGDRDVLVTAANEGWYAGRIEPKGTYDMDDPDVQALFAELEKANPVKIDYHATEDEVRGIEDRHGDGAMYCIDCGYLYWDQRKLEAEQERHHQLMGPIERFEIQWQT